ncbi:hypothetical protein ACHAPT_001532 [Fusarium lateritium]
MLVKFLGELQESLMPWMVQQFQELAEKQASMITDLDVFRKTIDDAFNKRAGAIYRRVKETMAIPNRKDIIEELRAEAIKMLQQAAPEQVDLAYCECISEKFQSFLDVEMKKVFGFTSLLEPGECLQQLMNTTTELRGVADNAQRGADAIITKQADLNDHAKKVCDDMKKLVENLGQKLKDDAKAAATDLKKELKDGAKMAIETATTDIKKELKDGARVAIDTATIDLKKELTAVVQAKSGDGKGAYGDRQVLVEDLRQQLKEDIKAAINDVTTGLKNELTAMVQAKLSDGGKEGYGDAKQHVEDLGQQIEQRLRSSFSEMISHTHTQGAHSNQPYIHRVADNTGIETGKKAVREEVEQALADFGLTKDSSGRYIQQKVPSITQQASEDNRHAIRAAEGEMALLRQDLQQAGMLRHQAQEGRGRQLSSLAICFGMMVVTAALTAFIVKAPSNGYRYPLLPGV